MHCEIRHVSSGGGGIFLIADIFLKLKIELSWGCPSPLPHFLGTRYQMEVKIRRKSLWLRECYTRLSLSFYPTQRIRIFMIFFFTCQDFFLWAPPPLSIRCYVPRNVKYLQSIAFFWLVWHVNSAFYLISTIFSKLFVNRLTMLRIM